MYLIIFLQNRLWPASAGELNRYWPRANGRSVNANVGEGKGLPTTFEHAIITAQKI